jgi:hypothetical protein
MLSQPQSFKCTLLIEQMQADPATPGKFHFSGKIINAEKAARNNSFYERGKNIKGFIFDAPSGITEGTLVRADVGFMGDPFVQNYQLANIEPVS